VVRIIDLFAHVDVRALARAVRCPALVMHARGDRSVPVAAGLEMATLLRGSTFVSLPDSNHLLTGDEPAWPSFARELGAFLRTG